MTTKAESENIGQILPDRQRRVIPYIVANNTVEEACRQAKITTTTYYNWLREFPEFDTAVREARNKLAIDSMEVLKSSVGKAVTELINLLDASSAETRRKAAVDLINIFMKWRDSVELADRLDSIETVIMQRRLYK